jgi:hypothetical protein
MRYFRRPALTAALAATIPAVVIPLVALAYGLSSNPPCGETSRTDAVGWKLGLVGFVFVAIALVVDLVALPLGRGARARIALLLGLALASLITVYYALDASFDLCFELPT